jgi:hypothetical protein
MPSTAARQQHRHTSLTSAACSSDLMYHPTARDPYNSTIEAGQHLYTRVGQQGRHLLVAAQKCQAQSTGQGTRGARYSHHNLYAYPGQLQLRSMSAVAGGASARRLHRATQECRVMQGQQAAWLALGNLSELLTWYSRPTHVVRSATLALLSAVCSFMHASAMHLMHQSHCQVAPCFTCPAGKHTSTTSCLITNTSVTDHNR